MGPKADNSEQFRLLDNVPIGICIIDRNYHIVFWNNCMESWTKKNRTDVLGKPLGNVFIHFKEKPYTDRIDPILRGGPPSIFSSRRHGQLFPSILPNGKSRILQTVVSHVSRSESGQYYALFAAKDFTELSYRIMDYRNMQQKAEKEIEQRKAVEAELRAANKEILKQQKAAIEKEKLKVMLQMAGATVHELSQPLMILMGNIELLEMFQESPDKQAGYIKKINHAGERIAQIIKKIQQVKYAAKKSYSGGEEIIDIHQEKRILCIENDTSCLKRINGLLQNTAYSEIHNASSLATAKAMLLDMPFEVVILDFRLPDGDAFDVMNFIKANNRSLPVIILTGEGDEVLVSKLIRCGANDYLAKADLTKEALIESLEFAVEKHALSRDKDRALAVMGELSAKDELTGLYNRHYFARALDREISGAYRYQKKLALCMMDIDYFKRVNDTYGRTAGDDVLEKVAHNIKKAMRQYDIPCRYGGEEFIIILPDTDKKGAGAMCERIRMDVAGHVFQFGAASFQITLSSGIALMEPLDHATGKYQRDLLVKRAGMALSKAQKTGRNKIVFA